MPKTNHKFIGNVTTAGFRKILLGEWLDVEKLPRAAKLFLRINGRNYRPGEVRIDGSNVYVIAGDEQEPIEEDFTTGPNG